MKLSDRLFNWSAVAVLALVAGIAFHTFRDYGLGWDDLTHAQYGQLLLDLYASGFKDTRALSFVNLYMYGGGFDMAAALLDGATPWDLFETRRLFGAMVGILGLFVTWRLARRLGGALAGLVALILLAVCPLYYGHMFINPKDSPFAVAMVILLFGLVRAIEDYPRPGPATVALVGIGAGLSIGSRILGGFAAVDMIAPLLLLIWRDARSGGAASALNNLGRFALALVPALILGIAIMAAIWPWSVTAPLNVLRAVGYFSHFFEKPWKEMYEGALVSVPEMPRDYVPTLFALKLPEVFLALSLGGIGGALIEALRPQTPVKRSAALLLIVAAGTLPILIAVATRPAMYNGIRHFVFLLPPLAILGGLAGGWLLERLRLWSKPAGIAAALALLGAVLVPVADMIRLHPYQYTHFNWIAGGIESAEERFMIDYWGLAFKEAAQGLRAKLTEALEVPTKHRRWRIAVCGPHAPAEVELGPEFVTTWDPKGADFAMMLGAFYCAELNAPLMVEIERDGVLFARVYDIRGRDISTLFTIPPVTR